MSNFKVPKNSIITFFTIIIVFFIALIVSNRGAYVDNDYQTYKLMFDDYSNFKVEPVFKYFSNLLNFLHLDFTYLLFIFCFFSILLKIYSLILAKKDKLINNENLIYFIGFYFFCFFALWDMTQIRASLAVSFLMLSFFVMKPYKKLIFKFLAIFSHYSISFVFVFELIYLFVKRNLYLYLLFSTTFCVCLYFLIGFTPYSVYEASSYTEKFNPISFKNLFIFVTFLIVMAIYFTYIFYLSDTPIIRLAEWGVK